MTYYVSMSPSSRKTDHLQVPNKVSRGVHMSRANSRRSDPNRDAPDSSVWTHLRYLLDPGLSTSRTIWVMPALKPRKAVRCTGFALSSLGKDLTFPRWRAHLLRGKKPVEPWRGAWNFRWDWNQNHNKVIRIVLCRQINHLLKICPGYSHIDWNNGSTSRLSAVELQTKNILHVRKKSEP